MPEHRYRRILVATDLKDSVNPEVQGGAEIARSQGAELTLLHVIEYFPEDEPVDTIVPEDSDPETYLLERARSRMEHVLNDLDVEHTDSEVIVSRYSAHHEIVGFMREHPMDLVVLGDGATGANMRHVVREAPCDVLIVRKK